MSEEEQIEHCWAEDEEEAPWAHRARTADECSQNGDMPQ